MDKQSKYLIISSKNEVQEFIISDTNELSKSLEKATHIKYCKENNNEYLSIDSEIFDCKLKKIEVEQNQGSENEKQFFILELNLNDEAKIEKFEEIDKELFGFVNSYSILEMRILEDAISHYYSKEAYELIHVVENKTRALITEVMYLKSYNMDWEKSLIGEFSRTRSGTAPHKKPLDGIYFSELTDFLFKISETNVELKKGEKSREQFLNNINAIKELGAAPLEEFDQQKLSDFISKVEKYAPLSVWDRYVADSLENKKPNKIAEQLKERLTRLNSTRNDIAHNKLFRKEDYNKLEGDVQELLKIIKDITTQFEGKIIKQVPDEDSLPEIVSRHFGKYYAVRVGKETGIYLSWAEVQPLVSGYSGAIHKSFQTYEEAQAFMKNE